LGKEPLRFSQDRPTKACISPFRHLGGHLARSIRDSRERTHNLGQSLRVQLLEDYLIPQIKGASAKHDDATLGFSLPAMHLSSVKPVMEGFHSLKLSLNSLLRAM